MDPDLVYLLLPRHNIILVVVVCGRTFLLGGGERCFSACWLAGGWKVVVQINRLPTVRVGNDVLFRHRCRRRCGLMYFLMACWEATVSARPVDFFVVAAPPWRCPPLLVVGGHHCAAAVGTSDDANEDDDNARDGIATEHTERQ